MGNVEITVTGVYSVAEVGSVTLLKWTSVNDAQTITWSEVSDAQTATWVPVSVG
jgi:hypothetical protein